MRDKSAVPSAPDLEALKAVCANISEITDKGVRTCLEDGFRAALRSTVRELMGSLLMEVERRSSEEAFVTGALQCIGRIFDSGHGAKDHLALRESFRELRAESILLRLISGHPSSRDVQGEALWVLGQMSGVRGVATILCDPEMAKNKEIVRGCLWAISCLQDSRKPEEPYLLCWEERCRLGEGVCAAFARFPNNRYVQAYGVKVLGGLMCGQCADLQHEQAVAALPRIADAMGRHLDAAWLQERACIALMQICDGNARAQAALRGHVVLIGRVIEAHLENHDVLAQCFSVLALAHGLEGVLNAFARYPNGLQAQKAFLGAIECLETDAETVARLDAVANVRDFLSRGPATLLASGVRALGNLLDHLLRDSHHHGPHIVLALDTVLAALGVPSEVIAASAAGAADEDWAWDDDSGEDHDSRGDRQMNVLESALEALGNAAQRSPEVAQHLRSRGDVSRAAQMALERAASATDYEGIRIALCTLGALGGPGSVCEALEVLVAKSNLHSHELCFLWRSSFRVLIEIHEPAGLQEVQRRRDAHHVIRLTVEALNELGGPSAFFAAAACVLGEYLGDLRCGAPEDRESWDKGLDYLMYVLWKSGPRRMALLYESCWALNAMIASAPAAEVPTERPLERLRAAGAGALVAGHMRHRVELGLDFESHVAEEALLFLGLLDGVAQSIVMAMEAFSESIVVQTAGCKAIADLYRLGLRFATAGEAKLAAEAVAAARSRAPATREGFALKSHAELALGAITQMEPSHDRAAHAALHGPPAG